jgi:hypothetical protein
MPRVVLALHPTAPCDAVRQIEAQVRRGPGATLEMQYVLHGDIERLLVPAQSRPHRADKLWQHTCFEMFVMADDIPGYYEFNFSPSTEWAIYSFSDYRDNMTVLQPVHAPQISVGHETARLSLQAAVDLQAPPLVDCGLRLALSAVVEDADGQLSYWALAHHGGKPDFHHPDGFILRIDPPVRVQK